jgi:hypothetical protein
MKFELKTVKFFEAFSEETNAFTAKLYINGKYVADVKNDGHGGCTDVHPINKLASDIISEAERYLASQPKKKVEEFDFEYLRTVESEVDDLFADWLLAKSNKQFNSDMEKGLLFGTRGKYQLISWKHFDVKKLLTHPSGKIAIKSAIGKYSHYGELLNTNIPEDFLN